MAIALAAIASSKPATPTQCSCPMPARAIIQPGGSLRDDEVIAAADELSIAMVFTGFRHFRH